MPAFTNKLMMHAHTYPRSKISEGYRKLRATIQYAPSSVQTLLVTSSVDQEGKTTTVNNLGIVYVQEGKNVLIVDGNLHSPVLHMLYGKENERGLSSLLTGECSLDQVVVSTFIPRLSILPAGERLAHPSELLPTLSRSSWLEQLKEHYDVILIDSPSVTTATDALLLASMSDGVILVVRQGRTGRQHVRKTLDALHYVQANVIGTVFNQVQA